MRDGKADLRPWVMTLVMLASMAGAVGRADAGCGCAKPAPPPGPVRPAFASPGGKVTLIHPALVVGQTYDVRIGGSAAGVLKAVAVMRRDFADGVPKPQIVVTLPKLAPGPAVINVVFGAATLLTIPATDFTVLPPPLPLLEGHVKTLALSYQAVAGADGTIYLPLDISPVAAAMQFRGRAIGHRLLFTPDDVVIYNTQGVVMQLLDPGDAGVLYTIEDGEDGVSDAADDEGASSAARSFRMTYNRHEFETYRDKHQHDPNYALDPRDPAWHADGTRHIDHHSLVIAISARETLDPDGGVGTPPVPGASLPFNFRIKTRPAGGSPGPLVKREIDWSTVVANGTAGNIGCAAAPIAPCRQPVGAGKSSLDLHDAGDDRRDAFTWRWRRGAATTAADFGDMLQDHALAVCLYDESGLASALVLESMIGIDPQCGTEARRKPCWRGMGRPRGSRGYRYRDRSAGAGGLKSLVLKPGNASKAGIVVKARGASLPMPALPLGLPLRMQLQTTTGQCWEAVFEGNVKKNTATRFKARSE